ncbi:MAG TPA: ABC transporter permease [Chitinophagaceae bacterium]|jgi:ABC-type antimicrobial peptide transport system permease subunit
MFKNFFKTAWRNLGKSKMHSFINIVGLSLGMAVAILIGLWMYDELTYNKNFQNYDRIAQVIQNVTNNGEVQTWKSVPYLLAEELRKNYGSDFKHIVMAVGWGDHLLTVNDKKLKATGGYFEKEMPEMFTLKMLRGNRNSLDDPASVLLSASAAKAYFGHDDPINKMIKIDDKPVVKVTGVYEDFPHNSTFADLNFISTWDFLYNNEEGIRTMEDPWRPNFTMLCVQLNDHVDINKVSAKIKDAKLKKVNPQLQKKKPALFLHPMSDWHLYSEFKNGVNVGGAIQYVWMFGIIGVFVLLLACINFMNLSTARSEKRAKEVGIRKTIGSLRRQLVIQFFSESLLTVVFAFALSLLLVQLTLPFFNEVSDKQMSILWINPLFWLLGIAFTIITALIAGSYPAFYLSSFKPIKVLKGTFRAGRFAALPRKVLVVLQFTVSVTLIIGTIIVYQQIQFAKNRPVGYSRNGLITIPVANPAIHDHFNAVKDELMRTGTIASITESGSPTTGLYGSSSGFSWRGKDPNLSVDFGTVSASYDYGKTIGWKIKEGRDFSRDFATDSSALILNEAAVHFMGLKKPVGETVMWFDKSFTVIGVINDMVMESPYDEPRPIVYGLSNESGNVVIIRINPTVSAKDALNKIEPVFKKFNPEQPFEYQFTDEEYAKKFGNEERIGKLASFFAILAIAISCLGLFGLASFVAEQRTKEIGVRKVLGASVYNVWNLLSRDFVVLVIISFLIAAPLAYYFMHNWLQNYNYRTQLSWWIFAAAGIGSLLITVIVVSFQAIKAAIANPVRSLRTE